MTRENIIDNIKIFIEEKTGIAATLLTEDKYLINDLGIDSLDLVELVVQLEKKFGFTAGEEDGEKIYKVGDLYDLILQKLENV